MARTLSVRGLGATRPPALCLVVSPRDVTPASVLLAPSAPVARGTERDVWSVPTEELLRYLTETAEQLALLVAPLHDALSGRQPSLPPIDQIDVTLLALAASLDGVRHWRKGGGSPVAAPVSQADARALWEAHDAACSLIPRLRLVAQAKRRGDRRPWTELSIDSIEEAFGALSRLGLLVLPPPPERVTEPCAPQTPYPELLRAWREAQEGAA